MRIRRRFPLLFALAMALALVGCSRQLITATPPTPAPINPRTASIGEIVNIVLARASLAEQLAQVTPGYVLGAGGQVQTGDESRARLDFSDAAIVRLAENSSFTMQNVTPTDDGLVTRLKLEAGKIWVSLMGGTLEVETPVGVATVRGSFAVIVYSAGDPADPNDDLLVLDCLEGSCSAQNDVVDERLGNLQRTVLTRAGRITFLLSDLDVQNFIQNNPEVADVIRATLTAAPPPTTTPAPTATDTPPVVTPESVPQTSATPMPLTPTLTAGPGSTTAPGTTVQIIGLHTVLPGETLFCIGRAYGVLPTAIAQVNGTALLTPGQTLRIPAVQWENIPAGPICPPQFTSPFPGLTPTNTPAPAPSATTVPPTDRPGPTDTSAAPVAPTNTPSNTPLPVPTSTPSRTPTKIPTVPPTLTPSRTPTAPPTFTPTNTPTFAPSNTPTPTDTPTITPTPDLIGPSISNLRPSPTALNGSTCDVTFQADVGDASGVLTATVVWTSFDFSGIQFSTGNVPLTGPSAGGTWSGTAIGINVPAFGHVDWTVSATDTLNNPSGPISGPTINETAGYGC